MTDTVTIVLPLPPRELWKNSRPHWAKKSAVGGKHRQASKLYTIQVLKCARPLWVQAVIDFDFYWPDKRRRDPLNVIGAMSWAIDGLVDAGLLWDDDKTTPGKVRMNVDAENPRVVMTVRKA